MITKTVARYYFLILTIANSQVCTPEQFVLRLSTEGIDLMVMIPGGDKVLTILPSTVNVH